MNLKKGVKNISYSVLGNIITIIIGIIIPRLVIISYGSEINGLLSSIGTIITYLALLEAGVGAVTIQALYKPITFNDKQSINEILSATHFYYRRTGLAYLILVVLISFLYPLVIKSQLNYWFMWTMILIFGFPGVISFFFQRKYITLLNAVGENYVIVNLQTIITIFSSLLKILLLKLNVDILIVQGIYCFTALLQMIYIHLYIKKKYNWLSLNEKSNFESLSQKGSALIHQISSLVTNSTDVIILSVFCDLKSVSIYSIYNMIYGIIYNLILNLNSNLQYALGEAYNKGLEYYCKFLDCYELVFITISSAFLTITYIAIVPFLSLYTRGADINYINYYLSLLFLSVKIFDSFRFIYLNTVSISGYFKDTQKFAIIESIINLGVSLILVIKIGLVGVLIGTLVAFLYRSYITIVFTNKNILKRNNLQSIKIIGTNFILICICVFISKYKIVNFNNYISLIVYILIVSVIVVSIFLLFNYLFNKKIYDYIFNYFRQNKL